MLFSVDGLTRPWGMEEGARRSLSKLAKCAETELRVWKEQGSWQLTAERARMGRNP